MTSILDLDLAKEGGFGTGLWSAIRQRASFIEAHHTEGVVGPLQVQPREEPARPVQESDASALAVVLGRYLAFVPSHAGYRLMELDGGVPAAGQRIEVGDHAYVVTKLGRSPLPLDDRRCAYLQAA